jgi:hypothetical protein
MDEHTAELASAGLGLIGALLLAIPFFADFSAKRKRLKDLEGLKDGTFSKQDAEEMRGPVEKLGTETVLAADIRMALCSGFGCLFLVASFVTLLVAKHS